jgi:glutamine amidotransferase
MIVIVDYGIGNLASVANMHRHLGIPAVVSSSADAIAQADRLILPGVGSFDAGMQCLAESGLVRALNVAVLERRRPVLGICLGMQLMFEASEEGGRAGLGWIKGTVRRFDFSQADAPLAVPHMGWRVCRLERSNPLFPEPSDGARFYFAHSFYCECANPADIAATATYGVAFVAAVCADNVMGVQFHPEKSHRYGMQLLQAFSEVTRC